MGQWPQPLDPRLGRGSWVARLAPVATRGQRNPCAREARSAGVPALSRRECATREVHDGREASCWWDRQRRSGMIPAPLPRTFKGRSGAAAAAVAAAVGTARGRIHEPRCDSALPRPAATIGVRAARELREAATRLYQCAGIWDTFQNPPCSLIVRLLTIQTLPLRNHE